MFPFVIPIIIPIVLIIRFQAMILIGAFNRRASSAIYRLRFSIERFNRVV